MLSNFIILTFLNETYVLYLLYQGFLKIEEENISIKNMFIAERLFYIIKSKGGVDLTEMEQKVLDAIINYINENGFGPSIRELGNTVGLKSTSTIHYYVKRLEEKGYIIRKGNSPRALTVVNGVNDQKYINITVTKEEYMSIMGTMVLRIVALMDKRKESGLSRMEKNKLEELNKLFYKKLLMCVNQLD